MELMTYYVSHAKKSVKKPFLKSFNAARCKHPAKDQQVFGVLLILVECKCKRKEQTFIHTHSPEVPGGMSCFTKADFTGVEEGELKPLL